MILSAHQPAYMPWAGYIHKIISSKIFVILDNVQFEKNSFANRNFVSIKNEPKYLTVPIQYDNHLENKIKDIKIYNQINWKRKHLNTIYLNYNKSPYYKVHIKFFEKIFSQEWSNLCELNEVILRYIMRQLQIDTKLVKLSTLEVVGKKTNLIINLCKLLSCDTFIFGANGREYVDMESGRKANLNFLFQDFDANKYHNYKNFKLSENLSIIDIMFNMKQELIKDHIISCGSLKK